jgi:hypothetical protein
MGVCIDRHLERIHNELSSGMQKILSKHASHDSTSNATDGYHLFIALITVVIMSTLAILLGIGLAMIA